jgi:hypothetical protein
MMEDKQATIDTENVPSSAVPFDDGNKEQAYPRGLMFLILTIGLMAVILIVALDNYIICVFFRGCPRPVKRKGVLTESSQQQPFPASPTTYMASISLAGMAVRTS